MNTRIKSEVRFEVYSLKENNNTVDFFQFRYKAE